MQDNTFYTITGILVKVVQQKGGRGTWGKVRRNAVEPSVATLHNFMCTCCVPRPSGKFMVALLYEQDCLSYYQW